MKLPKDLREFIESLNSEGVEYLIVGAHAVAFHGRPRVTGDLDIFVRSSPDNSQRIANALRRFGFESLGLAAEDFRAPDTIVQLGVPPNRIDIVTSLTGVEFSPAWSAKIPAELDGVPVFFINKPLLIKNKRATGRARDLADVEALEDE